MYNSLFYCKTCFWWVSTSGFQSTASSVCRPKAKNELTRPKAKNKLLLWIIVSHLQQRNTSVSDGLTTSSSQPQPHCLFRVKPILVSTPEHKQVLYSERWNRMLPLRARETQYNSKFRKLLFSVICLLRINFSIDAMRSSIYFKQLRDCEINVLFRFLFHHCTRFVTL